MLLLSHPHRGTVKGGSEIVEGVLTVFLIRENFTALDGDAILSGTPIKTAGFTPAVFVVIWMR